MASYATIADLDRKTKKGVQSSLFTGEEFLGAIDVYDSIIGRKRTKLILTDQRVVMFKRGFIRQSTVDYDRNQITNISFDKGLVRRKLGISGSGFSEEWYVDYEAGQQFASAIRSSEPQRILREDRTTESKEAGGDLNSDEVGSKQDRESRSSARDGESEPAELPGYTESIPESENYHYGAVAAIILTLAASSAGTSSLAGLLTILAGVLIYFDTVHVRRVSNWRPTGWLYALGTIFLFFIAMPIYYYRRYKKIGF